MIRYQGLSTLEVLQEAKNYNNWIASEILKHITPPVLEMGAGTGNLTIHFIGKKPYYITDKDKGLIAHLKKKFSKEKNIVIEELDISNKLPKKYQSYFSTVFGINVLEHIEDDETALKNIHESLRKNGKIVLLVPAKRFAYTKLDKELGHFRRYEKKELIEKLDKAGFEAEKIYFFNIVGLLSWTVRNKVKRSNIHLKPYHVRIFDSIVPVLRVIESVIPIPVGISLIAIARKK